MQCNFDANFLGRLWRQGFWITWLRLLSLCRKIQNQSSWRADSRAICRESQLILKDWCRLGSFYFSWLNPKAKNEPVFSMHNLHLTENFISVWTAHSLSFIDGKNNFHCKLFNKNNHFGCSVLGAVALKSHKSGSHIFKRNCQSTPVWRPWFWNLPGQYLIYKTMQHYRISAQRSNSIDQHD